MWWFTPNEERTFARRLNERRVLATRLSREAGILRLSRENTALAEAALRLAQGDEALFEHLYGEPMPAPLRIAVHLEVDVWMMIKNTLNNDERRLLPRRLDNIQKLLTLEREMLHTPLTRRYEVAIDRIHRDLKGGR